MNFMVSSSYEINKEGEEKMAAKICWDAPEWERITVDTYRMQVPGGWLVADYNSGRSSKGGGPAMAYVPDSAFTWEWKKEGEEK